MKKKNTYSIYRECNARNSYFLLNAYFVYNYLRYKKKIEIVKRELILSFNDWW